MVHDAQTFYLLRSFDCGHVEAPTWERFNRMSRNQYDIYWFDIVFQATILPESKHSNIGYKMLMGNKHGHKEICRHLYNVWWIMFFRSSSFSFRETNRLTSIWLTQRYSKSRMPKVRHSGTEPGTMRLERKGFTTQVHMF